MLHGFKEYTSERNMPVIYSLFRLLFLMRADFGFTFLTFKNSKAFFICLMTIFDKTMLT